MAEVQARHAFVRTNMEKLRELRLANEAKAAASERTAKTAAKPRRAAASAHAKG